AVPFGEPEREVRVVADLRVRDVVVADDHQHVGAGLHDGVVDLGVGLPHRPLVGLGRLVDPAGEAGSVARGHGDTELSHGSSVGVSGWSPRSAPSEPAPRRRGRPAGPGPGRHDAEGTSRTPGMLHDGSGRWSRARGASPQGRSWAYSIGGYGTLAGDAGPP